MARRATRQAERKPAAPAAPPAGEDVSYGDMLLHWVNLGYEVGSVVKDIQDGRDVQQAFKDFSAKAERAKAILAEIEAVPGLSQDKLEALRRMARDPLRVPDLEKELTDIKINPRIKEVKAEFLSLNIKGFESDAQRIQAKFQEPARIDEIEHDVKVLKRKIKERFFENEFAIQLEPTMSSPALATETIFIIHKDGTLLSVKSKQPKDQVDKKALSRMVLQIRERMGRGETDTFECDFWNVILETGTHVCVAVSFKGEELPIMRRVVDKVIQILERKNAEALSRWTGDRARLMDIDRYPTALFQALDALENKAE